MRGRGYRGLTHRCAMPALRTAVEMALTAVQSELSSWVISPVPRAFLPSSMTKRVRVTILVSKAAWSVMLWPGCWALGGRCRRKDAVGRGWSADRRPLRVSTARSGPGPSGVSRGAYRRGLPPSAHRNTSTPWARPSKCSPAHSAPHPHPPSGILIQSQFLQQRGCPLPRGPPPPPLPPLSPRHASSKHGHWRGGALLRATYMVFFSPHNDPATEVKS